MVIKPPLRRSAIAFITAALLSACGVGSAGSNSGSGSSAPDETGTVESPFKADPTATDGTAPAYGPQVDATLNPPANPTQPTQPAQGPCPAGLQTASGDLRAHLNARPIAAAGSEAFVAPSTGQLASFQDAFTGFVAAPSAQSAQPLTTLGFGVSCFVDSTAGAFLLVEDNSPAHANGTFAVSLAPAHDVWLEVPHAPSDSGTLEQGTAALISLKPRALLITGSHRCADAAATTCSGTTAVCGGTLRISDAAHFDQNYFTAAHRALRVRFPTTLAVSIHGMETPGTEEAVISDGTSVKRTASVSVRFRNALNPLLPGAKGAFSCNDSGDDGEHRELCGTTNVQGRGDNAAANVCTAFSQTPSDHFLHVEQSAEMRGTASGGNFDPGLLGQALSSIVPSL